MGIGRHPRDQKIHQHIKRLDGFDLRQNQKFQIVILQAPKKLRIAVIANIGADGVIAKAGQNSWDNNR